MANGNKVLTPSRIIATIFYLLIFPALIILLSGDWLWLEGWLFNIWYIVLCLSSLIYLYRKDPSLLEERYRTRKDSTQKKWDKYVLQMILIGFFLWVIIIPLDAKRFQWSPDFPLRVKLIGGILLLISFFFFFRAFTDNTFLSPMVRIQAERKQHVVSTGVYGFVRHPMYLGAILQFIGAPLLLGSMYGVLAGIGLLFILAGRILGEEKMLLDELEGYADYQKKVRYRLIPFIW
jgi:protein-S-isoprenylcysteine O-methyltransferase Ste14